MSARIEARTARVLLCLATGATAGSVWAGAWAAAPLLTVTAFAVARWAHYAARVANRPTHRRTT